MQHNCNYPGIILKEECPHGELYKDATEFLCVDKPQQKKGLFLCKVCVLLCYYHSAIQNRECKL